MNLEVLHARLDREAASPVLIFRLRVFSAHPAEAALLRCQIRMEPDGESALWLNLTQALPAFQRSLLFDLRVPVTEELAAFQNLENLPLVFLFSGSIYRFEAQPAYWEGEARYNLLMRTFRFALAPENWSRWRLPRAGLARKPRLVGR